jgi:hypothetical protein
MPHRVYTPPPDDVPERRRHYRREEDHEVHDIIDHAVADAPIVNRVLRTTKVAFAVATMFTLLGGVIGAFGYRMISPRDEFTKLSSEVEVNRLAAALRIDSLHVEIADLKKTIDEVLASQKTQERLNCASTNFSMRDKRIAGLDCQ